MDKKVEVVGLRAWHIFIGQVAIILMLFLGLIRATFRVRGMMVWYEIFILGMLMLLAFICLIGFAMHKKQSMFTVLYWLALFDLVVLSALSRDVFLFSIVVAAFGILFSLRYENEEEKSVRYSHSHEVTLPASGLSEVHHLASPGVVEKKIASEINKKQKKRTRRRN